jgi:hypothetical protein
VAAASVRLSACLAPRDVRYPMAPGNVKDAQQASIAFDTLETLARPSEKKRSSCARAAAARSIEMQCSLATCKSCSGTKAVKGSVAMLDSCTIRCFLSLVENAYWWCVHSPRSSQWHGARSVVM